MKFTTSTLIALFASPLLALAQNANPFKIPTEGISAKAGSSVTLNWEPTTSGTVTLLVRQGASSNLNPGTAIACKLQRENSQTKNISANDSSQRASLTRALTLGLFHPTSSAAATTPSRSSPTRTGTRSTTLLLSSLTAPTLSPLSSLPPPPAPPPAPALPPVLPLLLALPAPAA